MPVLALYKTPSPGTSIKCGEYYELSLDDPDGKGFILREFHGHWDEVSGAKAPGGSSEILSPPGGYPSLEEGNTVFDERKVFRARQGFLHGIRPTFNQATQAYDDIYEFVDVGEEI